MAYGPAAGGGRHGLLHSSHPLADCALGAHLDQPGVAVLYELCVIPTCCGRGAHGEIQGTEHREHRIGQVGGAHPALQVVQHPSIVGYVDGQAV